MITELSLLLTKAVEETLEDKIAVAFSGGLDSSIIAHLAKNRCNAHLFLCGTQDSEDMKIGIEVAKELVLPVTQRTLSEGDILEIYKKCHSLVPNDMLKVELLVPVYAVSKIASQKNYEVMLFGSGSEEIFVGYERYYKYLDEGKDLNEILKEEYKTLPQREIGWIKKVCRYNGIEARFPFYNRALSEFVFSIPLARRMEEKDLKKGLLREAATILKLPGTALKRKKKAMQYGSGVHKVLLKNADRVNRIK